MEEKNHSGLDQNVAGALAYFFGALTGIFFLVTEKENKFVRFHAMQSIMVTVAVFAIQVVIGFIPFLNMILVPLIGLATFAGWVFLMYKAFNNDEFMVPYIGEMAKKQIEKA